MEQIVDEVFIKHRKFWIKEVKTIEKFDEGHIQEIFIDLEDDFKQKLKEMIE